MSRPSIKTKKRSILSVSNGNLTKDELLFREIKETFRLATTGQLFNILLVMKNIKSGAYIVHHLKLKETILLFFEKYKLYYQIYNGFTPNTLRCFISLNPITHNLIINNKLQHIAIGKFLGYSCPLDIDINKKTGTDISISIDIGYTKPGKNNKIIEQIYGFKCNSINIPILDNLKLKAKQISKLGKQFPNLIPNFFCEINIKFRTYGK